jgi:hypothetical protein
MFGRKTVLALGSLIVGVALTAGATSLYAAAACKGLEKNACDKKSECSWVTPYTRKDGVKVSGHCRAKSGGNS